LTPDANTGPEMTEVIINTKEILARFSNFISNAKTIKFCSNKESILLAFNHKEYIDLFCDSYRKHTNIKYITEITKENIDHCKKIMDYVELRHLEGVKANFAIDGSEYLSLTFSDEVQKMHQPIQKLFYSNVKDLVDQQKDVFESFWNMSIPGQQRIKELEKKHEIGNTIVLQNAKDTKRLFIDLVTRSDKEVLLLLPTINAFMREYRIGIFNYLKESVTKKGINVIILTPTSEEIDNIIERLKVKEIENLTIYPFEVANEMKINTITIIVIDRNESLVIEKTDDSKANFEEAIGLSIYSTSKPTVISYVSIFESLINQIKLYEQLKVHGKMQEEFINIASHELRTPIQAILAYSDLIDHHPDKKDEMIAALKRNANTLQRLAEDILVVTKIESKTLVLHKEKFDLDNLLSVFIDDYRKNIKSNDKDIEITLQYINSNNSSFIIEADYQRIIQVITNLLDNAVKFTKDLKEKGKILIIIEENKNDCNKYVIVKIKDNGKGIDNDIIPRLFMKFATKSTKGTGLGLFISKNIIESHGGKIWAKNNEDGNGATFSFSLPL
jgi:signal transduction histidine kinase